MPLYDCMLLLKPHIKKEAITDLVARVGKHVCSRNGVLTDVQSLGTVQLGYGIKKLDGKYFQGQLMEMTMMAAPNINKELHYLNKEDRLLRWLLVKHRDIKNQVQVEFMSENEIQGELREFSRNPFLIIGTVMTTTTTVMIVNMMWTWRRNKTKSIMQFRFHFVLKFGFHLPLFSGKPIHGTLFCCYIWPSCKTRNY